MAVTLRTLSETEPRFVRVADGIMAQVIERTTPLPNRLDALLAGIRAVERRTVTLSGTMRRCTDADHFWMLWIRGVYAGLELRLSVCPGCGAVEVRDVSVDLLPGLRTGKSKPRRKDDVLGWYSGKRASGRVYL